MYKIIGIMFLSAMIYMIVPVSKSEAETRCSKDMWGNVQCSDSYGNSSSINKDMWGNTVIRDNRSGKETKCSKDMWGNVVCN
jgi:hypothetical protein